MVLIDELAHTNVPDSGRHEKRWEDVLEILDAGIAVITTVNIQHIESVADAVERITGVGVRERVPDWVVRRADQLELIDSSADQLRRRMLHGNITPREGPAALNGFFRAENLAALRELSLRFVADETEEELLEYLARRVRVVSCGRRPSASWWRSPGHRGTLRSSGERLASPPGSRRHSWRSTWSRATPMRTGRHDRARGSGHGGRRDVADGGGDDVAKTIFAAAIDQQITQIVVGTRG